MFRATHERQPRFYQTSIRLNVPSTAESGERVLEIDGDGQSVINLHGHNLSSFSKVILKGSDRGIINLQSSVPDRSAVADAVGEKLNASFEYKLRVEQRIPEIRRPDLVFRAEALSLELSSGKRIHLIAKKRVLFGRGRDNDVMLRFLPKGEENDACSRNLSRTHMIVECVEDGIVIKDESRQGIELNYDPVHSEIVLSEKELGYSQHLELAPSLLGGTPFGLGVQLFGIRDGVDRRAELLDWDEVCFDLVGERPSRLWQTSVANGIDAVRLIRSNNLPDLEDYVLLYREAHVGGSDRAINVGDRVLGCGARLFHAGRAFWLQTMPGARLRVDDQTYDKPTIIPLEPEQTIQIDQTIFTIRRYEQRD